MSSPSTLDLACSSDPHYLIHLGVPRKVSHSLERAQRRMVIHLSVPMKDGRYLKLVGLAMSKCLGFGMFVRLVKSW
jgi:hypothetical protein